MLTPDWVIVGAGLTGAVLAERLASQLGSKVLVVERRRHIGGNVFDFHDELGLLVHQYGPHVFHTNSPEVWRYLSNFTRWRPYEHRVLASVDGKLVPVPFNLTALEMLWPGRLARKVENLLIGNYGFGARVPILKLLEQTNAELRSFGKYVYDSVFENYTKKQWGLSPEQLDPSVTARVPVVISRDDRYFHDTYQAMPLLGYTRMIERMLSTPGVKILLAADFREIRDDLRSARIIYTGAIDEFLDRRFGALPYRSLRFDFQTLQERTFQPVAQVNFPGSGDYTRITEFKHITGQRSESTSVAFEFPAEYVPEVNEPFYPIPQPANAKLYERYLQTARSTDTNVTFAGRLADYRYYNMDQAVARALSLFGRISLEQSRAA